MKKALITGIGGQDAAYLAELLLKKGYQVYGTTRDLLNFNDWRLKYLGIEKKIHLLQMNLSDLSSISSAIELVMPDELYNLGAQSSVKESFDNPFITADVDAFGVLKLLEVIKKTSSKTKFYQASTSELFGKVQEIPQKETTSFCPRSPYGISKLFAHWMVINYRESYNIFACNGILFNHESPLRGFEYVTKKITMGVANIYKNKQEKIVLGNLDIQRDWGFAKEYVEGMRAMLQQETPDDYVLSTGKTYSLKTFVELAFKNIGIDIAWVGTGLLLKGIAKDSGKILVEVSSDFYRPTEIDFVMGDPQKANQKLGWESKTTLEELVKMMVDFDLSQ